MELIIKLYSDKPSKIGIKYGYEYSAVKAYEELLTKNQGTAFSLKMEMVKEKLSLFLVSEQSGQHIVYKDLEYKIEQLKKLQAFIQPGADLDFVHVFSKTNTLMIARPFRSNKFIKISTYEIIGPGYFANAL